MALRPPWEFIQAIVAASRSVRQSHKTLPWGVLIRIARWPMASLGVVMIDQKLGFESIWDQVLEYLGVSWEREVHFWPVGGTYWRGSCGLVVLAGGALLLSCEEVVLRCDSDMKE